MCGRVSLFFSDARRLTHTGRPWLRTDRALFIVGEVCELGLVEDVRSPDLRKPYAVARVRAGRQTIFVVADGTEVANSESEDSPEAKERETAAIQASS